LLAGLLAALLIADQLFPPPLPGGQSGPQAQLVVARDGTPLRAFPDREHIWRHPVGVEDVSPRYIEALVAYEDRSFWWHPGVNPWALLRAAWQWQRHGQIISGGSTLSMQVARLLEPDSPSRSAAGKLRQIARALQLELRLSKREILEIYLTSRPWAASSRVSKRPAVPTSAKPPYA
jgi:penicillin-binding protein 1C